MERTRLPQGVPVAFMIFNRPELTARVFDAIAQARPTRLLVVADGPRATHPDDARLCAQARAVIDRVDWDCEVSTCYSEDNLGCRLRIASGLDWVFAQAPEAIIVEDDCLPDPTFFRFCAELLERYRDDPRLQMVSGCNVLPATSAGPHSYYFSRCYHVWGWATWARAWRTYDLQMRRWPALRESDWLERHLGDRTEASIARAIFDETYAGNVGTWDFQWVLAGWAADGLSVTPSVNLVTNIGYGEAGTHERNAEHQLANLPTEPMRFPLDHPSDVRALESADHEEWRLVYPDWFEPTTAGAPRGGAVRICTAARGLRAFAARRRGAA
jgi:hypothetical protein